jgi:general secretion pathway protein A
MYNEFYGLKRNPFNMTPDPSLLFLTRQHREALAGLSFAILEKKGFVVLTGDAGTGKTTLLTKMLKSIPPGQAQFSLILNPKLTASEFLEMVLLDFGISSIPRSKPQRLACLQTFLLEGEAAGKSTVLIVDEAHQLNAELLEEIRLLGNFENPDQKLLQVVLVGQSELDEVLDREDLRQFKQRIALRLSIDALSKGEIDQYIRYRWSKAGATLAAPFSEEAILAIGKWSRGIPRVINAICDNALMLAFGEGSNGVDVQQVTMVAKDLRLTEPTRERVPSPAPAPPPVAIPSPAQGPIPIHPISMHTLERYGSDVKQPSLLKRWAGRLGLVSA